MVETLTLNGANHPFYVGSLPGRTRRRQHLLYSLVAHLLSEVLAENLVAISQQVAWELFMRSAAAALDPGSQLVLRQRLIGRLSRIIPILMLCSIVATGAALVFSGPFPDLTPVNLLSKQTALGGVAFGLSLAMLVQTIRVNRPINKLFLGWSVETLPADWQKYVLAARGHKVTAFVRRPANGLFDKTVGIWLGDARNREELIAALPGHDVIVNAIGSGTLRKNDVESNTTAVAVGAAQQVGIPRYIAMSAGMVELDWPLFKYVLRPLIFRNIRAEHRRVEEIVKTSALRWTIVRRPKLTNGPPRGYVASFELQPGSFSIARADVAAFIADELRDGKYLGQAVFLASCRDEKEK